jgi:hypothetical protein
MNKTWGQMRRRLLGLSSEATLYNRRGFRGASGEMQARLEQVGSAFLTGYHVTLEKGSLEEVARELEGVELELRGFAFEGAAMGLTLLDTLVPWRAGRISKFLVGAGEPHAYMVHVGVGWVWARLPFGIDRWRRRLDPLLAWLAYDGWGFHEGYFHWPNYIAGQGRWPRGLAGYEARAFDQGLGRSFWFVNGGNPDLIDRTIANFAPERRADLWSGIGLAAVYAGIVGEAVLRALRELAGDHWPSLAQGGAFAVKARQRAGNLTAYTNLAAQTLCGLSAREAARLCDATLEDLQASLGSGRVERGASGAWSENASTLPTLHTPDDPIGRPAYEAWRMRIQDYFRDGRAPVDWPAVGADEDAAKRGEGRAHNEHCLVASAPPLNSPL